MSEMTAADLDRDNAAFYEDLARVELRDGDLDLGLYFLDAADFYATPSPAATWERTVLLLAAMGRLSERTSW
jgi:hypothetical protein